MGDKGHEPVCSRKRRASHSVLSLSPARPCAPASVKRILPASLACLTDGSPGGICITPEPERGNARIFWPGLTWAVRKSEEEARMARMKTSSGAM